MILPHDRRGRWIVAGAAIATGSLIARSVAGFDGFALYVLTVTFAIGIRSTYRLARVYLSVASELPYLRRLVLQAFVVVSLAITLAAGYFDALTVRRMLGFAPFGWSSGVSFIIASLLFLIPLYLDTLVDVVASAEADREVRDGHRSE